MYCSAGKMRRAILLFRMVSPSNTHRKKSGTENSLNLKVRGLNVGSSFPVSRGMRSHIRVSASIPKRNSSQTIISTFLAIKIFQNERWTSSSKIYEDHFYLSILRCQGWEDRSRPY